jgi:hypothetical protein
VDLVRLSCVDVFQDVCQGIDFGGLRGEMCG